MYEMNPTREGEARGSTIESLTGAVNRDERARAGGVDGIRCATEP
jgi:hypothetical protein